MTTFEGQRPDKQRPSDWRRINLKRSRPTLLFKEGGEMLYSAKQHGRDRYILGRSCAEAQPTRFSVVA